jgi:hypothetical protein
LVVRSVPDCEGGGKGEWLNGEERVWRRRGSEEGEAGRRVQEVQPRRRGANLEIPDGRFAENQTPECGVKFHARISSSTVDPRNVQISRDVDRPVTIKARVIE